MVQFNRREVSFSRVVVNNRFKLHCSFFQTIHTGFSFIVFLIEHKPLIMLHVGYMTLLTIIPIAYMVMQGVEFGKKLINTNFFKMLQFQESSSSMTITFSFSAIFISLDVPSCSPYVRVCYSVIHENINFQTTLDTLSCASCSSKLSKRNQFSHRFIRSSQSLLPRLIHRIIAMFTQCSEPLVPQFVTLFFCSLVVHPEEL